MLSSLLDGSVDGEAQLLLRKLGKRDTVTKLKGLAELREALGAHDVGWLAAFMAHWVPCFCKLSADPSWQVREASCTVLGQMVGVLGRQLAPHLKPLMAAWLCARHDPHHATSSAAAAAFSAAFPNPKKLSDALLFCRDDLVRGLEERALTPLPKVKDKDEAAEAYETHARRVGSALCAASQLLSLTSDGASSEQPVAPVPETAGATRRANSDTAQSSVKKELVALLGGAMCGPDIWKLSSSKSAFVRLSAYGWAETILRHSPDDLASVHAPDLAKLLLGGLADDDAVGQAALWEPLLMLLSNHGSALTDCAAARHTLPRLASLLRHGCRGAAPTVSRALLPLAALLPLELFTLVDRSEGVGTSALPPAVALLDSIWEGLGSTSLPQAHIKEMMRAYGEILMLLLVRSSEGGKLKEGTVGLLSVGLLRHSMGKPIMALLTGKLPTKLNDAEVIEGIAAVAAQLAASTRCAAALTPYWREITETCAAMCTGAGPIGRPPTAAVRPAAALLAAIDAQLSQRQDSAPAAMQLCRFRSAVGALCTDRLYPAARYGAPGASDLLLKLVENHGLCMLWHASNSDGSSNALEPHSRGSGGCLVDFHPAKGGDRVVVVLSNLAASTPREALVASYLVEEVLLPLAQQAANWSDGDGAKGCLHGGVEVVTSVDAVPGSAAAQAARVAAALWSRLLAEEAEWVTSAPCDASKALDGTDSAATSGSLMRLHWRRLLRTIMDCCILSSNGPGLGPSNWPWALQVIGAVADTLAGLQNSEIRSLMLCEEIDAVARGAAAAALALDTNGIPSASADAAQRVVLLCCEACLLSEDAAAGVLELCGSALASLVEHADSSIKDGVSSIEIEAEERDGFKKVQALCARQANHALCMCSPLLRTLPTHTGQASPPAATLERRAAASASCLVTIFSLLRLRRGSQLYFLGDTASMTSTAAAAASAAAAISPQPPSMLQTDDESHGYTTNLISESVGWAMHLDVETSSLEEEDVLLALSTESLLVEAQAEAEAEGDINVDASRSAADSSQTSVDATAALATSLWEEAAIGIASWLALSFPSLHLRTYVSLWQETVKACPKSLAVASGWRALVSRWGWMVRRLIDLSVFHTKAGSRPDARDSEGASLLYPPSELTEILGEESWEEALLDGTSLRMWLLASLAIELMVEKTGGSPGAAILRFESSDLRLALPLLPLYLIRVFFQCCGNTASAARSVAALESAGWSGAAVIEVRAFVLGAIVPYLRGRQGASDVKGFVSSLAEASMARAVGGDEASRSALFLLLRCARPSIVASPKAVSGSPWDGTIFSALLPSDHTALDQLIMGASAPTPEGEAHVWRAFRTRLEVLRLGVATACATPPALVSQASLIQEDESAMSAPSQLMLLAGSAVSSVAALRPAAAAAARAAEARLGTGAAASGSQRSEDARIVARLRTLAALLPAAEPSAIPIGGLFEQVRRLALDTEAAGGGAHIEAMVAAKHSAICTAVRALVDRLGRSKKTLPLVLSHTRWMGATVESALRAAACAAQVHQEIPKEIGLDADWMVGGGWADSLRAASALIRMLLICTETGNCAGPSSIPCTDAASLLAACGGTNTCGDVDVEALDEAIGAAADRCERLQQAVLLLLLKAAPRAGHFHWAQRAWLEGLGCVCVASPSILPAAATLAPITRLIRAPNTAVRLLSLAVLESVLVPDPLGRAGGSEPEGSEGEHADEAMPLRYAFSCEGSGVASGPDQEPIASLTVLEGLMGCTDSSDGKDDGKSSHLITKEIDGDPDGAEARLLAWGCALALIPHMSQTARSRVSIGFKAGPLSKVLSECIYPALPLTRPPPPPPPPLASASNVAEDVDAPKSCGGVLDLADPTSSVTGALLAPLTKMLKGNGPDTSGPTDPPDVSSIAASLFAVILRRLPALARHWWTNDLSSRAAHAAIAKYTEVHVSPWLLRREAEAVGASTPTDNEDFTVKASTTSRTITATYAYEGTYMQIVLQLDKCHPLRAVEVSCTQRAGVSDARWRKWQRTISTMLRTQNGSIDDALVLFKDNVDKVFEGVEDCPICYQIVHGTTRQLPKLACRTCSNKFHAACLYKWFSSSQKSNCPLCQSTF